MIKNKLVKLSLLAFMANILSSCTYEVYEDPYWSPPPPDPYYECHGYGCERDRHHHYRRHRRHREPVPNGGIPAPPPKPQPLKPDGRNAGSAGPGWTAPTQPSGSGGAGWEPPKEEGLAK